MAETNCRIRVYQAGKLKGFLNNKGVNRLRIHASLYTDTDADAQVLELASHPDNAAQNLTFKVARA